MRNTLFLFICCLLVAALPVSSTAQKTTPIRFFQPFTEGSVQFRGLAPRAHQPERYTTWQLDFKELKQHLLSAPHESSAARRGACLVEIPVHEGQTEVFSMWATDIMAPELQAKFPDIRTYSGESQSTPGKLVRMTLSSARGLHVMIARPDMGIDYIEPYLWGQTAFYMQFDRQALSSQKPPDFTATDLTPAALPTDKTNPAAESRGSLAPVVLRTLRFTVSTTTEFDEDHGGTKESVMAAVVDYTNRTNVAYERDCAMRLQLVGSNDKLVVNPQNPFTPTDDNGAMAGKNRLYTNTLVGANNYDIGHVLRRGGGGVALGLGIACTVGKAGGCSAGSGGPDYGDSFVGVIGQETGHQLNAGHTWNFCGEGNSQRSGNSAYEPGSGSTIMSYAGACSPNNVVGTFDLYYHAGSIQEIRTFADEAGCGAATTTTNSTPVASLDYRDGFYIPIKTPFELKGTATDADGSDVLTYSWEEMDLGPESPIAAPTGNAAIFRTFPAVTNNNRYFPTLNAILSGLNGGPAETLPAYTRDLTFRFTVRDNHPGAGGVHWQNMAFKAFEGAGPFMVTLPNATLTYTWQIGEYERVTWDVANTHKAPVNCEKVNILLSTDGGKTFPIVLAAETPNDGSQYVLVPKINGAGFSGAARVKIESVGNVFFDISNRNFTIRNATEPTYTLSLSNENADICLPAVFVSDIAAAGTLGFSDAATLSLTGDLPTGATATISNTTLAPGGTAQLTIDLTKVTQKVSTTVTLRAALPNGTIIERPIMLQTRTNDFSALQAKTPTDGATGEKLTQVLRWQTAADAESYEVQLATTPTFTPADIIASKSSIKTDSFLIPVFLQKGKAYFWRIRPTNTCGTGQWTDPAFFSTFFENCATFSANDLPITISANSTPTLESKININSVGTVGTVSVKQIKGSHTFFKDLTFTLIGPGGTQVVLIKNKCGNTNTAFDFSISDLAANVFSCVPLPTGGRTYKPDSPLSAFVGKNTNGSWILRVNDNVPGGGGGEIQEFKLEFCNLVSLNPPFSAKNNPLELASGTNKAITNDLLAVQDANNTPAQLIFTLVTIPAFGHLEKNLGGAMKVGDTFTQADINAGLLRYFDGGLKNPEDYFRYMVTDNEGGYFGTPKFLIRPNDLTGTQNIEDISNAFGLYPNPASGAVWVALHQPADADFKITLYNAAGQLMQQAVLPQGADRHLLSLQEMASGLYWVRLENQNGVGVQKVIKE